MSCSADWTIKVWHTTKVGGEQRHILAFQPGDLTDHVSDIRWSPKDASVFGAVTGDGRTKSELDKNGSSNFSVGGADFTDEEKASFAAAEAEVELQKEKKVKRKTANDPWQCWP